MDEAKEGFECCDSLHGMMLKNARQILRDLSFANSKQGLLQWSWYFDHNPTIEEYIYYLN